MTRSERRAQRPRLTPQERRAEAEAYNAKREARLKAEAIQAERSSATPSSIQRLAFISALLGNLPSS